MTVTKKVLVLHPNDEQKIIKLQDEIGTAFRKWLNERDDASRVKIFKHFPLWCDVSEIADGWGNCKEGERDAGAVNKKIAGEISSVKIYSPKYQIDDESAFVYSPVEIKAWSGKTVKSQLMLSTFSDCMINLTDVTLPDFFMDVKIFRIGDAAFTGNEYYITDGVWRKLKK